MYPAGPQEIVQVSNKLVPGSQTSSQTLAPSSSHISALSSSQMPALSSFLGMSWLLCKPCIEIIKLRGQCAIVIIVLVPLLLLMSGAAVDACKVCC